MVPCKFLLDAGTSNGTHRTSSGFVIDQVNKQLRELGDVVRGCVYSGIACRDAGFAQVEGDNRKRECHVFHRFVHGGEIVQWVLRIRRDPNVGGGEDGRNLSIGDPPGERDEFSQVESFAQPHEVVEAVSRSDKGELDVTTAEAMYHVIRQLDDEVHSILRTHDPKVCSQVGCRATEGWVRLRATESGEIGTGTNHRHVRLVHAIPPESDLSVGVIGGDHVVRGLHCA